MSKKFQGLIIRSGPRDVKERALTPPGSRILMLSCLFFDMPCTPSIASQSQSVPKIMCLTTTSSYAARNTVVR
ncbi:hypothetical protein BofuT4_uP152510.1 [Botrytis cinerea T4]|uniref:Uncharacterized protein n=1 Tax=Botryotinia fuckeliana (strain T4) TaxID=999810 RepID=G2YVP1_BOTF4|nr:hypothetical protein BofuT4_uP152510.1 [Botrytis cinerea T4]